MSGTNQTDEQQEPVIADSDKEFMEAWQESESNKAENNGDDELDPDIEQAEQDRLQEDATKDSQDDAGNAPAEQAATGNDEDDEDDIDSLRADAEKLQQRLRSAEGRLRNSHSPKLETEVENMRRQLDQIHEHLGIKQPAASERSDGQEEAGIPDGFNEVEWADFQRDFPESAKAMMEKQKQKDNVSERLSKLEEQGNTRRQEEERIQFEQPILEQHPDYHEICKSEAKDVMAFVQSIDDPVKRQGAEIVIAQGSADQIIALVSEYKTWRASKASQKARPNQAPTRDASAAVAVPSRGGSRPSVSAASKGNKDDYEAAWNEADVS